MRQPKPITIDFETFGIEGRPKYPPIPVGVSIKKPGRKAKYYAFGHPTENNCCWSDAAKALEEAYQCKDGVLFQNGKFDVDVAEEWFDLALPEWDKIHDTMFLLFLDDPHQRELGLKEAAARLLDWPAEEQDAIAEWLIANQPVPGVKISKSKSSDHYFGRYLCFAPGKLTGKYADGDVDRTEALFNLLWRKTADRGMLEPYNRERRLMPILLEMERQGVPVDLERLRHDVEMYDTWRKRIDEWLIEKLQCDANINFNSGQQLFNAMLDAGLVDEDKAPLTATGKYQTNKDALLVAVNDKQLLAVLKYRTQLNTCLNTFMSPWLHTAEQSDGLIFTHWNQVRAPKGADNAGTRTGRLSSTPNFQNIPNEFKPIFKHDTADRKVRHNLPPSPFKDLPPLPKVRSYVTPFDGEVLIDRDYSQQEPRILAHFDGGDLMAKYVENPWIDFHDYAKEELEKMGKHYDRKPVKNTNLGLIYGMGVGKLAERNEMSVEESSELKKAILHLYPGLKEMYKDMKMRAANKLPIRTWGGREYYCEEPKLVAGRLRHFDYKLVNVLIQGSAADCTKEAIIRFHAAKQDNWKIILNVHDQITASVPKRDVKKAMEVLRQTMESVEFDVPILSEGDTSSTNWDELKPYDVKGEIRV
jgi:DNA polymerase I-like protein with 3'-5' exonuclease and polymerase domains